MYRGRFVNKLFKNIVLGSRINTAEELIQTHHKDGNNQNRRISVGIRIFCVSAGTNQQVGKRTDKHNQN